MTNDRTDHDCPSRRAETCSLCAGRIAGDFIAEITSAAKDLSEPVSANQFFDMLAHGEGSTVTIYNDGSDEGR